MKNKLIKYDIKRDTDNIIISVQNDEKKTVEIFMSAKPSMEQPVSVSKGTGSLFAINAPKQNQPYYFKIIREGNKDTYISERTFSLDGAINVRDSGGYITKDGKRVKWGKFLRGDQLTHLSTQDIEILSRVPVLSVIDYRSSHEQTLNPNKIIDSVKATYNFDPHSVLSEAAGQASDLNDENVRLIQSLEDGSIDKKYINSNGDQVKENYRNLVLRPESQEAYRDMFKVFLNTENAPILQHCRGGKDRTGFGIALIHLALGVTEEDILKDYTLTEIVRKDRNKFKMDQYKELTDNKDYLDYLLSLIESRAEYLKVSLDTIIENYGSYDEYFEKVMGLKESDIKTLRDYYLEEV